MSRRFARAAFIIALVIVAMAVGIGIGQSFFGWGGGLGAVLGVAALLTGGTMFDRFLAPTGAIK